MGIADWRVLENSHKYKVSRSTFTYKKNSRMLFNIKFQNAYNVAL
jgi:hypothetical protein